MKRILIIRFSSIGDIVLTSPVVRCIKEQVDPCEIHFVTKSSFASIAEANPHVDKVHSLKQSLSSVISDLKKVGFDHVIDLHNNIRSRRVTNALGVHTTRFNKLNTEKWLLTNLKVNKLPNVHIVDRYLETASILNVKNDKKGLEFFIPKADEVSLSSLPDFLKNGYIALVIGAGHFTKKLPENRLKQLLEKMTSPVVIIGGPEDESQGASLASNHPQRVWNAAGKLNLFGSASIVRQSKVVITHDTGMMHIAAAFQKKIISIWGNTVPEFGMYPYMPSHSDNNQIVQVNNLKCRPCSKIGYDKCPKGHFKCMNSIDLNNILQLLKKY